MPGQTQPEQSNAQAGMSEDATTGGLGMHLEAVLTTGAKRDQSMWSERTWSEASGGAADAGAVGATGGRSGAAGVSPPVAGVTTDASAAQEVTTGASAAQASKSPFAVLATDTNREQSIRSDRTWSLAHPETAARDEVATGASAAQAVKSPLTLSEASGADVDSGDADDDAAGPSGAMQVAGRGGRSVSGADQGRALEQDDHPGRQYKGVSRKKACVLRL